MRNPGRFPSGPTRVTGWVTCHPHMPSRAPDPALADGLGPEAQGPGSGVTGRPVEQRLWALSGTGLPWRTPEDQTQGSVTRTSFDHIGEVPPGAAVAFAVPLRAELTGLAVVLDDEAPLSWS
jgi:hypothetical protein